MSYARRAVLRAIKALSGPASGSASAPTSTGVLLTLTTPDNPTFRNGDRAVARLAPGVAGRFTFTRERVPISGAAGAGNSATYVRADRTGVPSSVTPTLAASIDPAAFVNFVGVNTVGRKVQLSLSAGLTGDTSISTGDSGFAPVAVGAGSPTISYTIQQTDVLPMSARAANILASDADKVIQAEVTDLTFTAGLTDAADPDATLSFYGSGAVGSTVVASCIAGCTGTIRILRADGSPAATASVSATLQYTVQAGDAPMKAVLSDLVYTVGVPLTAGPGTASGFLTVEYDSATPATRSLGQGDIYKGRLPPGVTGLYTWYVAGVAQSDVRYPGRTVSAQLNAASFQTAHPGDGPVSVSVSSLTFSSPGVYAVAPPQNATGAPFLYSIDVLDSARSVIRLGYLPLADLDAAHVPSPSDYSVGGGKTVTAVALNNSGADLKYVQITVSPSFEPADFLNTPAVSYSGTAVRYPGGQPASTFSGLLPTTDMPLLLPLVWPPGGQSPATVNAGQIFVPTNYVNQGYGDAGYAALSLVKYQDEVHDYVTNDECSIQMSILPDWGTDTNVMRFVGFHTRNNNDALNTLAHQLRRNGNTISYREHDNVFGGQDVDSWSGFTFPNPGPLCLAKLVRSNPSRIVSVETSEDGGKNWAVRHAGTLVVEGLRPKCGSNQTAIPITGVGFIGFEHLPTGS